MGVPKKEKMHTYPFPVAPNIGQIVDLLPGLKWMRLTLPFRLDHVNIYLVEDGDGWTVIDAGIYDESTIETWCALLRGPLRGLKLNRLIVTHHHPDHIGMAGWLCARQDMPLLTSQTAYLLCDNLSLNPGSLQAEQYRDFYLSHGMQRETADQVGTQGHQYLSMVSPLPITFRRLVAGDTLMVGERKFRVLTGDGHAPEQIMLYCAEDKLLFSSDQVIAKITPNISVWAVEPDGDPLGHFMRSLRLLKEHIPDDVLVLPGHQLPFRGLHQRCNELLAHHEERCRRIYDACLEGRKSTADLVPVIFERKLDAHQLSFAFAETLAHINRMVRRSDLQKTRSSDGIMQYSSIR